MNRLMKNCCCWGSSKYLLKDDVKKEELIRTSDKSETLIELSGTKRRRKEKEKVEDEQTDIEKCENRGTKNDRSSNKDSSRSEREGLTSKSPSDSSQKASSSCPQLTIEEPTSTNSSADEESLITRNSNQNKNAKGLQRLDEEGSDQPTGMSQTQKQVLENRSLLTKTYSFRRMLSFRGSFRGRDSVESMSNNFKRENDGFNDENQHRPLQFSFLGQIYAKKSLKKQYRRHSSSLRWSRPPSGMTITTNPLECDNGDQKRFAVFAIENEEEEEEERQKT